jgi:hypothetical protein
MVTAYAHKNKQTHTTMSYSSGMLNKRIVIAKRANDQEPTFGKQGQRSP